jgi:uncharacterized protein YegP (UPF0339 family)
MAGSFELIDAPDGGYRVRMLDGSGTLMAVSVTYPTKKAAAAGVVMAREIAGTGLIRDRSHDRRADRLKHSAIQAANGHRHSKSSAVKGTHVHQHRHLHAPTPMEA